MEAYAPRPGTMITFYSYKGGTGRSMAVANVACLIAGHSPATSGRVLVIDWDLEAPGLHRFFAVRTEHPEFADRAGIIDYFYALRRLLTETTGLYTQIVAPEGWKVLADVLPIDSYLIPDVVAGVDLIKSGRSDDPVYAEQVGSFDWVQFYNQFGATITAFREMLTSRYGYCLIDSRTGLTDMSGICTMLLPEKLVMVFTPNRQSLYGVLNLARRATLYRRSSDDFRPLAIFPLPSRIELAEKALRDQWREEYQRGFEALFREVYGIESCDLLAYFDDVQLPHMSYYSYGENIAVLEERSEALSLSRAYEVFVRRLAALDFAWERSDEVGVRGAGRASLTRYADFEVAVGARVDDTFPFSVRAPGGDARGTLVLPTNDPEYGQLIQRLYGLDTDEAELDRLGQLLFNALFQGPTKEVYTRSQGGLLESQGLRIKFNIAASEAEVDALPWEFLNDPSQGPLALLGVPVIRYLPQQTRTPTVAELPLKILLTGAQAPSSADVERELREVREALSVLGEYAQITIEPHLTVTGLQRRLREGFNVWHFVGHGQFSDDGTTGQLLLEANAGVHPVSAPELAIMLNRSAVRLVILDSSDGARLATDPFRSLAPALVRAQVPTVIAIQFIAPEQATQVFVRSFYQALVEGFPIDFCMAEGRKAVMNAVGLGRPDWGFPVIYTRVPDGKLFEFPDLPATSSAIISASGGVQYGMTAGATTVTVNTQTGTILSPAPRAAIERLPHISLPPRPSRGFLDREEELRLLQDEVQPGRGAWLYGQSGCGLSALLRRAANTQAALSLPDGVAYLDGAAEPPQLDDIVQRLFQRFYTSDQQVRISPESARAYLGNLRALFVLDQLLLNRGDTLALVDMLANGSVLVAADGPGPDTLLDLPLGGLPRQDAIRLISTEARIDVAEAETAALLGRLCAALGDLPLPLLLAARLILMNVAPLEQLVAVAEELAGEREPLARVAQLVLTALADAERAVLTALVRVTGHDVDVEALAVASGQPLVGVQDALKRLIDLRLVTAGNDRYALVSASLHPVLDRLLQRGAARDRAGTAGSGA